MDINCGDVVRAYNDNGDFLGLAETVRAVFENNRPVRDYPYRSKWVVRFLGPSYKHEVTQWLDDRNAFPKPEELPVERKAELFDAIIDLLRHEYTLRSWEKDGRMVLQTGYDGSYDYFNIETNAGMNNWLSSIYIEEKQND